jgi:putative membrane protein
VGFLMMGFGILNMIFWIIVVGLVIYGVMVLLMKPFEKKEDKGLDILNERFASGEINEQEYKERRNFLKENR